MDMGCRAADGTEKVRVIGIEKETISSTPSITYRN
jgi:hypothetical protein